MDLSTHWAALLLPVNVSVPPLDWGGTSILLREGFSAPGTWPARWWVFIKYSAISEWSVCSYASVTVRLSAHYVSNLWCWMCGRGRERKKGATCFQNPCGWRSGTYFQLWASCHPVQILLNHSPLHMMRICLFFFIPNWKIRVTTMWANST